MTKPQDIFGAAPKSVLNKPFMHVQDKKPSGTAGGSSIVGDNLRDLTDVLANDIQGASLNKTTMEVTLPAGDYFVKYTTLGYSYSTTRSTSELHLSTGITYTGMSASYGTDNSISKLGTRISLNNTTAISVHLIASVAKATIGLGTAYSLSTDEIYTDLKIWKLDTAIRTPIANNGGVYPIPANTHVVGNVFGFNYKKTGDHTIQVQPGTCFDALNSTLLTGALQTVTISAGLNTIYNLFICDDGVVRPDVYVDGSTLSGTYNIRWRGFVLTDENGVIYNCSAKGSQLIFSDAFSTHTSGTNIVVDFSPFVPLSRVDTIEMRCGGSSYNSTLVALYQDAVLKHMVTNSSVDGIDVKSTVTIDPNATITATGGGSFAISTINMKI